MEVEDSISAPKAEGVNSQEDEKEPETTKEQSAVVTLNALLGNACSIGDTMRVTGTIGTRTLNILVDTGRYHNFISEKFRKVLSYRIKAIDPLQVTVADGGKIQGSKFVENFEWTMQGHDFIAYVILFPLVGCDLILGMQWLQNLGSIMWDCSSLTDGVYEGRRKLKLIACQEIKN